MGLEHCFVVLQICLMFSQSIFSNSDSSMSRSIGEIPKMGLENCFVVLQMCYVFDAGGDHFTNLWLGISVSFY
jgi:hypothetical protein